MSFLWMGLAQLPPGEDPLFASPFRVQAGGSYITVNVGHAAPCVADLDGDGVNDLLVGQFGEGKLRIYRNYGTNEKPEFRDFKWFEAGGKVATVSYG